MGFVDNLKTGLGRIGNVRSVADVTGPLGRFINGESSQDRAAGLLNNEFRDVNQSNFFAPGLQGATDQRGQVGQQLLNRRIGGITSEGAQAQQAQQQNAFGQGLLNQFQGNGPGQEIARRQAAQQQQLGLQQQQALAQSARGGNAGLLGRSALNAGAGISQGAQNAAVLGGLGAQQQAGQLLGQNIAQQNAFALQNANLLQGNQQFNAGANLSQGRLQQEGLLAGLGQQNDLLALGQRGAEAAEAARTQRFGNIAGQAADLSKLPTDEQGGLQFLKDAGQLAFSQPSSPGGVPGAAPAAPQDLGGGPPGGFV